MEEKEEIKKALPPYLPYKTLRHFIDSMKVGMPNRIDRELNEVNWWVFTIITYCRIRIFTINFSQKRNTRRKAKSTG